MATPASSHQHLFPTSVSSIFGSSSILNKSSLETSPQVVPTESGENGFSTPKRFPVYCAICMVPIRDLISLKKHRTIKRHYCPEYPTTYQKQQGFVKKDYRKSWRKERNRLKTVEQSNETIPVSARLVHFDHSGATSVVKSLSPDLHEFMTSPSDQSGGTSENELSMDECPNPSIHPSNNLSGGYFTYSKQNAFVKHAATDASTNTDPILEPKTRFPSMSYLQSSASVIARQDHEEPSPFLCEQNQNDMVFFKRLKTYREQQFLTDIFLIVEEKKVYAHKIILSASSAFFKNIFDKCLNTSSYGLRLDFGFTYEAFVIALDFMYGTLPREKIHVQNAKEVKAVALKLELEGLSNYSQRIMETNFELPDTDSLFCVETALAELSDMCADFNSTALDADQFSEFTEPRKGDLAGSGMDMSESQTSDFPYTNSGTPFDRLGLIGTDPCHESSMASNSQSCEGVSLGDPSDVLGVLRHDYPLSSNSDAASLENTPLSFGDEFFNFGESSVLNNNTMNTSSSLNNNTTNSTYDSRKLTPLATTESKTFAKSFPLFSPPRLEKSFQAFPSTLQGILTPASTSSFGHKPPTSQPQQSNKEFTAMLSTHFSGREGLPSKPYMNCIICNDAVSGQTQIEKWIKLCQHLAEKHKKVIDREILTKQFGIKESAITSSVLEGDQGSTSQGSLVFTASLPDQKNVDPKNENNGQPDESTDVSDNRKNAAKVRLGRFLSQKKLLNSELMVNVKRLGQPDNSKDERVSCLHCSKEFDTLLPVQRHLVVNHNVPLPGLQVLLCKNCGHKDVEREENLEDGQRPSKTCNVCKHVLTLLDV